MTSTKFIQFNLVKFPILFPLIYGIILYSFPNFEKELILITILLLGETHFGATWPFFINKNNFFLLKRKKNRINCNSSNDFIFFFNWFYLF